VENPDEIKLGGDSIYATVFFSDIANFTTYSEGKSAEEVITILNKYFESFSEFILDNKMAWRDNARRIIKVRFQESFKLNQTAARRSL
jgi:class 3 adenylate cyclase